MAVIRQQDRFAQAAGRHLTDALVLASGTRLDNAVYLAGYVVECSLKTVIEHHLGEAEARRWGHDLSALQGRALQQLCVMVPHAQIRVPASRTHGTVLEQGHPVRRYWASGQWSEQETRLALERASEIYRETVVSMVADGYLPFSELNV
jgi:HEPN domain-containing protein